jgi:putative oxygen-independent coproporphyrinogen III oxidase
VTPTFLYVHVPFCARRCSYCDFAVTALRDPPVRAWLDAVEAELAGVVSRHGWDRLRLSTLYVGGGTPSLLGAGAMAELRGRLSKHADLEPDAEWTVEANPESFNPELARDWRGAGVNRLSLGAQSFDARVLRWMGRLHGVDGVARAMDAARGAGLENVSLDLIFALPSRLGRDWAADLERAVGLEPDHLSLYGLTIEPETPLGRWVREGRETPADEDTYATEYLYAAERLAAAGFEHYEVSSFARGGKRSRHNSAYWRGVAYLGLGPGAHSYVVPVRWWNLRAWQDYRSAVARNEPAVAGEEVVVGEAYELEQIWLQLRTADGLSLVGGGEVEAVVRRWVGEGWAWWRGRRVGLTPRGWLLLDRLAVELRDADARDGAA